MVLIRAGLLDGQSFDTLLGAFHCQVDFFGRSDRWVVFAKLLVESELLSHLGEVLRGLAMVCIFDCSLPLHALQVLLAEDSLVFQHTPLHLNGLDPLNDFIIFLFNAG